MKFTKMHGLGNDYIYVDCFQETVADPEKAAKFLSDRHFGVGSDGLVLIKPSKQADFEMAMYNADGSRGEMCGNAIRCVAKYVYDHNMTDKTSISIETLAGIKYADLHITGGKVASVRVNMGQPELIPQKIPVVYEMPQAEGVQQALSKVVDCPITVGGTQYRMTCVSMGNPHCVVYVDDVDSLELAKLGTQFERHACFPNRVNTEFVRVLDKNTVQMRVWERGSGETLACGTGACAVTVASILNGYTNRLVTVKLLGGDLVIEWDEQTGIVYMTGSAEHVFDGEIAL
ncbi:MAG: diaminopimelate epimerase [Eubacterium sp.]|nr:diaminopimelate epimerase [Eubacterium sp.]